MGELADRIGRLEDTCIERGSMLKLVSRYYPRTLAALAIVGALLWGYFEFRVYPEIIKAQNDVHALRKEMYIYMLDKRSETKGAAWGIDFPNEAKSDSIHAVTFYNSYSTKSFAGEIAVCLRDTAILLLRKDTIEQVVASCDAESTMSTLPWLLTSPPISPGGHHLIPAIATRLRDTLWGRPIR